MTSLYLYGILPTPGPAALAIEGLDRQPVAIAQLDGFAFLYSPASQPKYLASRRNLLAHERVLEEVMQQGWRTVLPLQFGMVVEDWQAVSDQLSRPHGAELAGLLARLEGRREVSVKVFWDEEAELERLLAEQPVLRERRDALVGRTLNMDEVIGIGQAIEAGMAARRDAVIGAFRDALGELAFATVENDPLMAGMIFNAAYLIPWEAEPEFGVRVEALDRRFEERLRIRYNNFTAPFNFAQLSPVEVRR